MACTPVTISTNCKKCNDPAKSYITYTWTGSVTGGKKTATRNIPRNSVKSDSAGCTQARNVFCSLYGEKGSCSKVAPTRIHNKAPRSSGSSLSDLINKAPVGSPTPINDPDADCNGYGIGKPFCVLGKMITNAIGSSPLIPLPFVNEAVQTSKTFNQVSNKAKEGVTRSNGQAVNPMTEGDICKSTSRDAFTVSSKYLAGCPGPTSNTDLAPHDQDCANYLGGGGIFDAACVWGKSITKGTESSFIPILIGGGLIILLAISLK